MKQPSLKLQRRTSRRIDRTPVDLSRADFGPEDGFNFRLPIQQRPVGGFAWRYGRPGNRLTVGKMLNGSDLRSTASAVTHVQQSNIVYEDCRRADRGNGD